ncbi:MAG: hypothetical protein HRF49_07720 [bacterium]|jgi:hypothetical protein
MRDKTLMQICADTTVPGDYLESLIRFRAAINDNPQFPPSSHRGRGTGTKTETAPPNKKEPDYCGVPKPIAGGGEPARLPGAGGAGTFNLGGAIEESAGLSLSAGSGSSVWATAKPAPGPFCDWCHKELRPCDLVTDMDERGNVAEYHVWCYEMISKELS